MKDKVLYLAMPYKADTPAERRANVHRAEDIARQLWREGYPVVCPHANCGHLEGHVAREDVLAGCLELLTRCDAIVLGPGWWRSEGAVAEARRAYSDGLEIWVWGWTDVAGRYG